MQQALHLIAVADPSVLADDTLAALTELRQMLSATEISDLVTECARAVTDPAVTGEAQPTPLPEVIRRYLCSPVDTYVVEAAWIATNIASGSSEATAAIYSTPGMLDALIAGLTHPNINVAEQVTWALGNIAGDCVDARDLVLSLDVAAPMIAVFTRDDATDAVKNNAAWAISNLCRGRPPPPLERLTPMMDFFCEALAAGRKSGKTDRVWLQDVLWGAAFAMDQSNEVIQLALDRRLLQRVMAMLRIRDATVKEGADGLPDDADEAVTVPRKVAAEQLGHVMEFLPVSHLDRLAFVCRDVWTTTICLHGVLYQRLRRTFSLGNPKLRTPALRLIGNIVSGTDAQTEQALNEGVLLLLEEALACDGLKKGERKEIAWVLSNVAAGTPNQVRTLLSRHGLVDGLAKKLLPSWRETDVATEAFYVITNALASEEIAPLMFNEKSHSFQLLAPTLVAIQGLRSAQCESALRPVVRTWNNGDEVIHSSPAEVAFFYEILEAPDAWDRAWHRFQRLHSGTFADDEAEAVSACLYFKRLAAFLATTTPPQQQQNGDGPVHNEQSENDTFVE